MSPLHPTNADAPQDQCLIMVRHTAVDESLRGFCYGASDVELSGAGKAHVDLLTAELIATRPSHIFHSGLLRTRHLADMVAVRVGATAQVDRRIAEFDFGEWEMRRWDDIHADGHDIARLVHEPETFAPPGGETVFSMRDRVMSWYRALPRGARVLAISHGGPISALRGSLTGVAPAAWPALVPAFGEQVRFKLPRS